MKTQPDWNHQPKVDTNLSSNHQKSVCQSNDRAVYLSSHRQTLLMGGKSLGIILSLSLAFSCLGGCRSDKFAFGLSTPPNTESTVTSASSPKNSPLPTADSGQATKQSPGEAKVTQDDQLKEISDSLNKVLDPRFKKVDEQFEFQRQNAIVYPIVAASLVVVLLKLLEFLVSDKSPFITIRTNRDKPTVQPEPQNPGRQDGDAPTDAPAGVSAIIAPEPLQPSDFNMDDFINRIAEGVRDKLKNDLREELKVEREELKNEFLSLRKELIEVVIREVKKLHKIDEGDLQGIVQEIQRNLANSVHSVIPSPEPQSESMPEVCNQPEARFSQSRPESMPEVRNQPEARLSQGRGNYSSSFSSPKPPLPQPVQKIVQTYNAFKHDQSAFKQQYNFSPVAEMRESFAARYKDRNQPAFFSRDSNGSFWAVGEDPGSGVGWLMPKGDIVVNEHSYPTITAIFECHDYRDGYRFELVAPARLYISDDLQTIELKERGELRFFH